MTDYRKDLYQGYVSEFKRFEGRPGQPAQAAAERYFNKKHYPHLQHLKPDSAILELGCGPGNFLAFLAAKGFAHLQGIDISQEQIELAKSRGLNARCEDVFSFLTGRPESCDAIIAIDFVEHFTKEEVLKLFKLVSRSLRPGGVLLLQTPNGEGLFASQVIYGDLTHCTIFTGNSLAQALRPCGFEKFEFAETGPAAIGFRGAMRQLCWGIVKYMANFCRRIEAGKTQQVWSENIICSCRKPAG